MSQSQSDLSRLITRSLRAKQSQAMRRRLLFVLLAITLFGLTTYGQTGYKPVSETPTADNQTATLSFCPVDFEATVQQGPNAKNLTLIGLLTLESRGQLLNGWLLHQEGYSVSVRGRLIGRGTRGTHPVLLTFFLGENQSIVGIGRLRTSPTEEGCLGLSGGGTLTGPDAADTGDWGVRVVSLNPPPPAANTKFVAQLYRDLLQREADPAGLSFHTNLLNQGQMNRQKVALSLLNAQEYRTNLINELYQTLLDRPADPAGLNFALNFLNNQGTVEQLMATLIGSAEYFQTRAQGSNEVFLGKLYQDLLGRAIDATALKSFSQSLERGTTRTQIAEIVLGSAEYRQRLIQSYYLKYLGRPADAAGLKTYLDLLDAGARREEVQANLTGAEQYLNIALLRQSIITSPGPGLAAQIKLFDSGGGQLKNFTAFSSFTGGVRVALGDIDGDSTADIITAAGPGAGPHVQVFSGASGLVIRSFFAYGVGFTGGVFVAAGDVNGDGFADIITGAGAGGGPHVKVFSGATGAELASFFAYSTSFTGGVTVAAGDVNGDGRADIITGAGAGAGPHVKVFNATNFAELHSFFAYSPGFTGGVFVAAGDVNDDGRADIITSAGAGAGPHVKVFNGVSGAELRSFFAYGAGFTGGVNVAAGDINGDGIDDIITGAGPGTAAGHVKVFNGVNNAELVSFFAYPTSFTGGVFVGAAR